MGDEVHKAGVGAGVGAAASVDVQVFGSVLFNGELHAGNFGTLHAVSFTLSFSITSQLFSLGF